MPKKYKLLSEVLNEERRVKPIPSRVDYNLCNYCSTCALKFSEISCAATNVIRNFEPNLGIVLKQSNRKEFNSLQMGAFYFIR